MKPSEVYYKALNLTLIEATLNEDERKEQRAALASNPRLLKRLGALSLHHMVHFVGAEKVLSMHEFPYRHRGFEVLGHGCSATAFREPGADRVCKIVRGTDRLSETDRLELARNLKDKIAVSETFLPDVTVPTAVTIGPSPVLDRPAIQLLQPFVSSSAERPDPREIIDFAERSLEEMMPNGYLPDVKGRRNLINTDSGIRLIDTVPISAENTKTFGLCAVRLYEMASAGK